MRPNLHRYSVTWDTDVVVRYLKDSSVDSLKNLAMGVTVWMALITAQRAQMLHVLALTDMTL